MKLRQESWKLIERVGSWDLAVWEQLEGHLLGILRMFDVSLAVYQTNCQRAWEASGLRSDELHERLLVGLPGYKKIGRLDGSSDWTNSRAIFRAAIYELEADVPLEKRWSNKAITLLLSTLEPASPDPPEASLPEPPGS